MQGEQPQICPKCGMKLEKVQIELKHTKYCKGKTLHKKVILDAEGWHEIQVVCHGTLCYDEGAEGNFCNECEYYDGVK